MHDVLLLVARSAMLVFLLSSMLDLGLGLTPHQILDPLKNARLVILALAANFVIVPLLAVAIARALELDRSFANGLLLLGLAPGAPFLPKVAQVARSSPALAVGLLVLLMAITVVYLPLVMPLVFAGVEVDGWVIGRSLLFFLCLPLVLGLVIRAQLGSVPPRLRRWLGRLSSLSGLTVLVLIVAGNMGSVLSVFGTGAVLASVVFVVLSASTGWLLGGPDRGSREVLALGTGLRNVAAALVVGSQSFEDPAVNVMVIVSSLIGILILLPAAFALGNRIKIDGAPMSPPPAIRAGHGTQGKSLLLA